MPKTPYLLEVPKDSPTHKQRLEQIKVLFQIETNNCPGLVEDKWVAVHMDAARAMGKGYGVRPNDGMFECVSKIGRLLDESGIAQYGKTEREAIEKLCKHLDLPLTM